MGGGCLAREPASIGVLRRTKATAPTTPTEQNEKLNGNLATNAVPAKPTENKTAISEYGSKKFAGTSAPLLAFTKAGYDAATQSGKLVVLYFYANWCPLCQAEFPEMIDAFNQLSTDQVVGFQVHFNDSETGSDEQNLAREFGVAYQHTKVFVKNGSRILKAPDSWDQQRYLQEIYNALQ